MEYAHRFNDDKKWQRLEELMFAAAHEAKTVGGLLPLITEMKQLVIKWEDEASGR